MKYVYNGKAYSINEIVLIGSANGKGIIDNNGNFNILTQPKMVRISRSDAANDKPAYYRPITILLPNTYTDYSISFKVDYTYSVKASKFFGDRKSVV